MDIISLQKWAFIPSPPDGITPICDLLVKYSNIPLQDINAHLIQIRDQAWAITRAPFIGRWKFLRLSDSSELGYKQALFRLRLSQSKDAFLDLGCGLGQALRQLRADGVDGSQLYGLDLDDDLIKLGYDLFQDEDFLDATFCVGDIIDSEENNFNKLHEKVTIIHAGSFFHLFTWTQQLLIGKRMVSFLKSGTQNALIYGTCAGTSTPQLTTTCRSLPQRLHNKESLQRLWDEVGELTRTSWKVEAELASLEGSQLPFMKEVQILHFTIIQLPQQSPR